jgi:hypothetical protein
MNCPAAGWSLGLPADAFRRAALLAQGCEDAAWRAVSIAPRVAHSHEDFQAERRVADAEAMARREARGREFALLRAG